MQNKPRISNRTDNQRLRIKFILGLGVVVYLAITLATLEAKAATSHSGIITPKEIAINDTTFIKQMKASLNEGVSEPPVEGQVRPINVSYDGSYGVNEEYLRRICNETTQR